MSIAPCRRHHRGGGRAWKEERRKSLRRDRKADYEIAARRLPSEKSGLIWHTPYAVTYFLMLLTYFLVLLHTFFSDILLQVFWHTFDYLLTYLHYVKILLIIFWHTCGMLKYLQLFVDIHSLCWNTFDNMLTYTCYFKNTFDNMLTYTCYVGILLITCWHTRAMLNHYWLYVDIHVLYWAILT